jgi:hypothetical protein
MLGPERRASRLWAYPCPTTHSPNPVPAGRRPRRRAQPSAPISTRESRGSVRLRTARSDLAKLPVRAQIHGPPLSATVGMMLHLRLVIPPGRRGRAGAVGVHGRSLIV